MTERVLALDEVRRIHVIGIGGAGMSAIATVLCQMGHVVTGSDLRDGPGLDRLRVLGVAVHIGHDVANLDSTPDVVTISTAIPAHNVEVVEARRRGIPVLRRAEVLAAIAGTRRTIAVAGTHGKTTTSSMLALVLSEAEMQPSFIIGGEVNEIGTGAAWSDGEWFVVEADESDGTFLELPRAAAIVTSVEPDHLEHYGGEAALRAAFERFVADTPGPVVVCADDAGAARLVDVRTYGTSPDAEFRMVDVETGPRGTTFALQGPDGSLGEFELAVPGLHNARNAVAATVTGVLCGAAPDAARRALARFAGVARRFEFRGETAGVTFVDDYAHLPTEVDAALDAAGDGEWKRIICVFQPHRFSRTEAVWRDFGEAFDQADVLAVTDIYPAGEQPRPGVTGMLVVQAALEHRPWRRVAWLPRRSDVITWLCGELRDGDLCLTLGAGDLTSLPDEIQDRLALTSST